MVDVRGGTPGQAPAPGPSILDISGLGHHGQLADGGAYVVGGVSRVAIEMPGNRSQIVIGDHPVFELQSGFTLEAYLKLNALGSVCCDIRLVLFRGDRRSGLDPWLLGINNDGGLTIATWDGAASHVLRSSEPVGLGHWVHVAGTHDATDGRMRLYINGRQIAESDVVPPPYAKLDLTRAPSVTLGNAAGTSQGIRGAIDSARITARALRPVEFLPPVVACRADLDGDGILAFFDFLVFQDGFAAGDLVADFDGDGGLTIFDFLAFQNEFWAGCP